MKSVLHVTHIYTSIARSPEKSAADMMDGSQLVTAHSYIHSSFLYISLCLWPATFACLLFLSKYPSLYSIFCPSLSTCHFHFSCNWSPPLLLHIIPSLFPSLSLPPRLSTVTIESTIISSPPPLFSPLPLIVLAALSHFPPMSTHIVPYQASTHFTILLAISLSFPHHLSGPYFSNYNHRITVW